MLPYAKPTNQGWIRMQQSGYGTLTTQTIKREYTSSIACDVWTGTIFGLFLKRNLFNGCQIMIDFQISVCPNRRASAFINLFSQKRELVFKVFVYYKCYKTHCSNKIDTFHCRHLLWEHSPNIHFSMFVLVAGVYITTLKT